jgi:hypothetical protein
LVNDGTLYEWRKPRSGTQPEKYLARIPQPLDPDGKEIFTSIFTAILPCEHLREDDTERCSHFHPPLGGVNICREHHEHQEGVVLLPVNETSAREDGPPPLPACLGQRQPDEPPTTAPPPVPETAAIPKPAPIPCPAKQPDQSRCIITVKNPAPWQQQAAQSKPAANNTPPPDTYQSALLELGTILLKDEDQTPWFSLRKISGQCIKHWVKLPRLNYSILYLSDWANEFFPKSGEIRGDRVKVTYKTEPSESKRPPDLFIQFVKVFPDGSCN